MPTNVGPEYRSAEARYRAAATPQEQLAALQEMLRVLPKHKGTDKLQADLKRRIARARKEQKQRKTGGGKPFYHVDRAPGGMTVLVGPPNSGKSSLLAALTNAEPEVADYPYTTRVPMPGMMRYENAQLQLVDLPPVALEGTEPWVFELVRYADLVLVVIDANDDDVLSLHDDMLSALKARHVVLEPPGLDEPGNDEQESESSEDRAAGPLAQPEEEEDEMAFAVPAIILASKVDTDHAEEDLAILRELLGDWLPIIGVSAHTGRNLKRLPRVVFDALALIRVYTKAPGKEADKSAPFLLPRGSTVQDAARAVHRDFVDEMKYARIWGTGHFDGQMVGRDDLLRDEDVIEFHV
jgi:ribosome-interacting GTPase 1